MARVIFLAGDIFWARGIFWAGGIFFAGGIFWARVIIWAESIFLAGGILWAVTANIQTPKESWKAQRPKLYDNNNKDYGSTVNNVNNYAIYTSFYIGVTVF